MTMVGTGSGALLRAGTPRSTHGRRRAVFQVLAVSALVLPIGVGLALHPDPISMVQYLPYGVVGAILIIRRPRNPIGWVLALIAAAFVGTSVPGGLDINALRAGTATLEQRVAAWVLGWSGHLAYAGFFALAVLFPAGRLPPGAARAGAIAGIALGTTSAVIAAIAPRLDLVIGGSSSVRVPNPIVRLAALEPLASLPVELLILLPISLCVVGIGSMVIRFRRSTGITRLQFRWLGATLALTVLTVAGALAALAILGPQAGDVVWFPAVVAYPTVPVAIGIAVLRYRLYDIDRVVSRTVAYSLVTGTLALLFVAGNLVAQTLLASLTQASTIGVALSTLLAFAVAQPLLRRTQRLVDRRFDRTHIDAEQTVRLFGERQRDQVDLAALVDDIRDTASASVRPASVGVWLTAAARGADR